MLDPDRPSAFTGSTFVIRIWLEWSQTGSCWRGQITHVQSSKRIYFTCLDNMLNFIQGHVAMPKAEERESIKDR
jgi:hypothetical protein